ncbi:hypothetical protein HMPREF2533_02053, partial [Bacteroides fragilis]
KRFNVFFDMKHQRIGFQPIPNFTRVVNPLHQRFHILVEKNRYGRWVITRVADSKDNYYKAAGLREGDEIKTVNGKNYEDYLYKNHRLFEKQDTLLYEVIRKEKILKIVVAVNKEEIQGD